MVNKDYWIAFSSIEQIDSSFVQRLYNYFGDVKSAFEASIKDLSQIDGLSVQKAETFVRERDKVDISRVCQEVAKRELSVVTFDDDNYPYMLRQIADAPMILYCKGDLNLCNLERTLAVVGSRKASTAGKDVLAHLISEFSGTDICIVSGLAYGIDTVAHTAALRSGLKTIGVIAGGLDYIYPTSNKELYKKIENGFGAVVSEYYPTFQPLPFRFPQRNRIVTGLSYGTLVAEAALKSGALISANLSLEQGRELMCIPGLISNPNTQGIYKLLKNGATMVTCAEDILEALGWEVKPDVQLNLDLGLTEEEKRIITTIEVEPKSYDVILNETKMNSDDLLVLLTNLELSGNIKQIEGKYAIA